MKKEGENLSYEFNDGKSIVIWQDLSEEEQRNVLNMFASGYNFFIRFYKENEK
jgi:hypothetical protein